MPDPGSSSFDPRRLGFEKLRRAEPRAAAELGLRRAIAAARIPNPPEPSDPRPVGRIRSPSPLIRAARAQSSGPELRVPVHPKFRSGPSISDLACGIRSELGESLERRIEILRPIRVDTASRLRLDLGCRR
jgi:hypothetical protein